MCEYKVGDKVVFLRNVTLNALHANGNNVVFATDMLKKKFLMVNGVRTYGDIAQVLYLKENPQYWLAGWFKPYIEEQLEFDFNA